MKHNKAARFFEPIFAVENYMRVFQHVHVSFQTTSYYNIASVNALNECTNFVDISKKGRGKHKRQWVVTMNHAQRIYLATYFWIEVVDCRIKNTHVFYQVWKFWHYPMNYCLAITIAYTYDIYLYCCEGLFCPFWKVENFVTYRNFREILSSQMLSYNPVQKQYTGDNKMREVNKAVMTQQ